MKILALETSCEIASVALLGDDFASSQCLVSPPAHSTNLLPLIRQMLESQGLRLADLDVIAFGRGPGAFTGGRLACSVAQGLAVGANLPVAAVDSLLALAEANGAERVYCAMDARMNEAYVARYVKQENGWGVDLPPACLPPLALPLPEDGVWAGVGTAFRAYADALAPLAGKLVSVDAEAVPTALAVARLARDMAWQDAAEVSPLYVRDRVALTVAERLAAGGRA